MHPSDFRRPALFVLLTLCLVAVTAWATLMPPVALPQPPGNDKFWHVAAFAAMIAPTAVLAPRYLALTGLALALYGVAIELIQPYVGRQAELADAAADVAGLGLGALVGLGLRRLIWR